MSIWCTWEDIGYDLLNEPKHMGRGEVRSYAEGWSNHYPTTDGTVERPASVSIAHSPRWCIPGHGDDGKGAYHGAPVAPWMRLDMTTWEHNPKTPHNVIAPCTWSVVMDEQAARALAADLLAWADRQKIHPR